MDVRQGILVIAIMLLGPACGGEPGVPRAEHEALLQRLDAMDRRLDALEESLARPSPVAEAKAEAERAPLELGAPRPSTGDEPEAKVGVHVTAGGVEIDGKAVADADLLARFREIATANPGARLTLMADSGVPYSAVIHTLDVAREAGLRDVAMAVRVHGEGEGAVTAGL